MVHMLRCSLLTHPCTLGDLLKFNGSGKFDNTMMMMLIVMQCHLFFHFSLFPESACANCSVYPIKL